MRSSRDQGQGLKKNFLKITLCAYQLTFSLNKIMFNTLTVSSS